MNRDNRDLIDWDRVMYAHRCSGGHSDIMCKLFKGAEVIAKYKDNDYQGNLAYCYKLDDTAFKATGQSYLITTDYFGSCSGCDVWEAASDDVVRANAERIVFNNTVGFANLLELSDFFDELKSFNTKLNDLRKQNIQQQLSDRDMELYKFHICENLIDKVFAY
jgi:hypothetical protein